MKWFIESTYIGIGGGVTWIWWGAYTVYRGIGPLGEIVIGREARLDLVAKSSWEQKKRPM